MRYHGNRRVIQSKQLCCIKVCRSLWTSYLKILPSDFWHLYEEMIQVILQNPSPNSFQSWTECIIWISHKCFFRVLNYWETCSVRWNINISTSTKKKENKLNLLPIHRHNKSSATSILLLLQKELSSGWRRKCFPAPFSFASPAPPLSANRSWSSASRGSVLEFMWELFELNICLVSNNA